MMDRIIKVHFKLAH